MCHLSACDLLSATPEAVIWLGGGRQTPLVFGELVCVPLFVSVLMCALTYISTWVYL